MFVIANLLKGLATVLHFLIGIMQFLIMVRALISWVNPDPNNPIVQFLNQVTEPILTPVRKLIPMWKLGLDISPIIAWLLLWLIDLVLIQSLFDLSMKLR